MISRFGFSIATEVDPDILIIDEVLAVGDVSFKKKKYGENIGIQKKGNYHLFCFA